VGPVAFIALWQGLAEYRSRFREMTSTDTSQ
jgi:hypothetical protein